MTVNAIILTGGRSRRFGGEYKPGVDVGGKSTISRILNSIRRLDTGHLAEASGDAGSDADSGQVSITCSEVWVAGPVGGLSAAEKATVHEVREEPAFAGPLAGIAAAVAAMSPSEIILVLAGDMPMITASHLGRLIHACRETGRLATAKDDRGKTQFLCAAWPSELLRGRLNGIGDPTDRAVRLLFSGLEPTVVDVDPDVVSDFDTAAELEAIRTRLQ